MIGDRDRNCSSVPAVNCASSPLACTYDRSAQVALTFLFSPEADAYGVFRSGGSDLAWSVPGPYDFWLAGECAGSNTAEEFLCYDASRHVFDIFEAANGTLVGTTDSVMILAGDSGVRVIGRDDSTARRLVFRDGNQLKLYTFGEFAGVNEPKTRVPGDFTLRAFPNPFNPTTEITFDLPTATNVKLQVFNVLGQCVATLAEGPRTAGPHAVKFDGSALSSGVYLYRLEAGSFVAQNKMLLAK